MSDGKVNYRALAAPNGVVDVAHGSTVPFGEADTTQILYEWNDTKVELPSDKCIHELFEEQVGRSPEAAAIVFETRSLTYAELNARANQLAHYLQLLGVGPETLVGICVEQSLEMVVGLLGILKAGGAYVPLDPRYPPTRLKYMVEDADIRVLLAGRELEGRLFTNTKKYRAVYLDVDWEQISNQRTSNPASSVSINNAAYVIYTSGSTGNPKGVLALHRGVSNQLGWINSAFSLSDADRVVQKSSISFDASVPEIFAPLLNGAQLVLAKSSQDIDYLVSLLLTQRITFIDLAPSLLQSLLDHPRIQACTSLRCVVSGGESLPPQLIDRFFQILSADLYNTYGPTETTVQSTSWKCLPHLEHRTVPIGRPIANTQVYVLDHFLKPLPLGETGEIYLAGAGLARGYLGRPDLTAEKFLPNPFSEQRGERLYRTGDTGRWCPDGCLEFLGRSDRQVKIRGFRVELEEIESILLTHDGIREAVVVARGDALGSRYLVAYVVPLSGMLIDSSRLRAFLSARLPAYMVPAFFVMLSDLPRTNGKVDHRKLPKAGVTRPKLANDFVSPRNVIESTLAYIWGLLLGIEQVGAEDHFLDLGGHSLLAAQVISQVNQTFGLQLSLDALLEASTIANLAVVIARTGTRDPSRSIAPIRAVDRRGPIPLSFSQEQIWFFNRLDPASVAYQFQQKIELIGSMDADALRRALEEIVRRHEILRTAFVSLADQPVQVVQPPFEISMPIVDLRGLPAKFRQVEAERLIWKECQRVFDVAQPPLIRWMLLRLDDQRHVLLHSEHHMVHDGWSVSVFLRELAILYEAFIAGEPSPMKDPAYQFADFAIWQREWMRGSELKRQLEYWRRKLDGYSGVLNLPTTYARPKLQSFRGNAERIELPTDLYESLRDFSRHERVTLFMTMLAVFKVLLWRHTEQDDILVGSAVANRRLLEFESMLGMFVNPVLLRTDLSGNPTFRELLSRVRRTTIEAYEHQDLPFVELVKDLRPDHGTTRNPLFQVAFSFHDSPIPDVCLGSLKGTVVEIENGSAKFDFNVVCVPRAEQRVGSSGANASSGLTLIWEYNTDVFDEPTALRFFERYRTLLETVVSYPEKRISELALMSQPELELLRNSNKTEIEYPREKCIHELFEEQVERSPDATAVVFEGAALTYEELNRRANRLAHYLRAQGVRPDARVAICVERGFEMVVGLLAVLKAGGAYVPLDPAYPKERLRYMLEDSRPVVLLTGKQLEGMIFSEISESVQVLNLTEAAPWSSLPDSNPDLREVGLTSEHLAYVIYTSGSTGTPKGVMNEHRGLVNRLCWMQDAYQLDQHDVVLQKTPLSFDVSVWEFFWPLQTGARLVMARPDGHKDPAYLVESIGRNNITTLHFVPSMLQAFLRCVSQPECPSLVRAMCSGEALSATLARRFQDLLPTAALHNLYGPTEAAVDVTAWTCPCNIPITVIPIGAPIANTRIYILSQYREPVPVGVPGEIHIGGVQVARGYWNRPELTAERFLPDPFTDNAGARMFKTGDIGRWQADGNIEFLGRNDDQVKIRGFRIELGDIEAALTSHPAVREVAVVAREDEPGEKRLVAYITPSPVYALPVLQMLRLVKNHVTTETRCFELPNGLTIFHQNQGETKFLYEEIFVDQMYLKHGVTLRDGDCVFDVGANIGLFTLFVSQRCPNTTIYAFEPIPTIFESLRLNATLYGLNGKAFQCGLADRSKSEVFTFYPRNTIISGSSIRSEEARQVVKSFLLNQGFSDDAADSSGRFDELVQEHLNSVEFKCQLRTISDVVNENVIERIDLLKVDVEGAELDVLRGIEDGDWRKIKQLVVEVHDISGRLEEIVKLLQKRGYGVVYEQNKVLTGTAIYNLYAVRAGSGLPVIDTGESAKHNAVEKVWSSQSSLVHDLSSHARARLPEYMVPAAYVILESIPLTPNGKLDRKALPAPERNAYAVKEYEEPRGKTEKDLAEIWAEVLKVESVGRHDNFFELGGHSLLATAVIERMRREGLRFDVRMLFATRSLAEFAATVGFQSDSVEIPPNRLLVLRECKITCSNMVEIRI